MQVRSLNWLKIVTKLIYKLKALIFRIEREVETLIFSLRILLRQTQVISKQKPLLKRQADGTVVWS
jgi:hypothetical protein